MHSQVYTEIVFKFACCSQGIQVTLIQKWILSFWGDSGYWIEKNQVYGGRNGSRGSLEFHRGTSVNKGVKGKARLSTLLSLFFLQNLKRAVLNVEQIVPSIRGRVIWSGDSLLDSCHDTIRFQRAAQHDTVSGLRNACLICPLTSSASPFNAFH